MTVPATRVSARGEFRHTTEHEELQASFDDALDVDVLDTSETAGAGAVNHDAATAHLACIVSTGASDRAIVRSHARPRPAAGSWRLTRVCARFVGEVVSQSKRVGIGDDDDGAFFELEGETLYAVRRSSVSGSPVEVPIAAAQWNGDTTSVVLTNEHVFEIRDAWPTGDLQFFVDGLLVHTMSVDGSIDAPAWKRSRLPLLLECANAGVTTAGGSLEVSHASIVVGQRAASTSTHTVEARNAAVPTSQTSLVAIQPRSTFGSVDNHGTLSAQRVSVYTDSECLVEVLLGATLGGVLADHAAESRAQSSTAPGSITGGRVVAAIPVSGFASITIDDEVRRLADGTQQTLTVAATAIAGTATVAAALTWRETP
jgi:hypothetical protein